MSWVRGPHGGLVYTGGYVASTTGGVVVDPTRPDLPGWRWLTQTAQGPWTRSAWAGGSIIAQPISGGILIQPDPSAASMLLTAWWVGASYLRITRIVGDDMQPVRNASPAVLGATRRNLCTNPSFEVNTSGWISGANTTLTRQTGPTLSGAAFGRGKANAAGAINLTVPVALPTTGTFGASFDLMLSAAPSGALTITATWQDAVAAALTPSVVTIPSGSLTPYVGRWDRLPVQTLTPPSGAVTGALAIQVAGNLINATADVDGVLIEIGTSGPFFDGDTYLAAWTGTAHTSTSALAPAVSVIDRECPLDVPVRYQLSAPDWPSHIILSEPSTLDSRDQTWLSHPTVGQPMVVVVAAQPEETRTINRELLQVIGRSRPIAVTGGVRHSITGTLLVHAMDFGQRDRIWALLEDGIPLLLRAPARLGHGPGEWISIGDVALNTYEHGAWEKPRTFSLPYQVVDPPPSATAA